jgi:hypothetical protein
MKVTVKIRYFLGKIICKIRRRHSVYAERRKGVFHLPYICRSCGMTSMTIIKGKMVEFKERSEPSRLFWRLKAAFGIRSPSRKALEDIKKALGTGLK